MSETTLLSYESAPTWRNGIHRNLKKLCRLSEERSIRAKRLYKIGDLKRPVSESMGFLTPIQKSKAPVDEPAACLQQRVIDLNIESSGVPRPAPDRSSESPTRNMDDPLKAGERRKFHKSNSSSYHLVKGKGVVSAANLDAGQNLLLCKNLQRPFQNQALSRLRVKAHFQSSKPIEAISQCNHQSGYNQEEHLAEEGQYPLKQSEWSGIEVNGNCNKSEDVRSLTPLICGVNKLPPARHSLQYGQPSLGCGLVKNNHFNVSPMGVKKLACPQNILKSLHTNASKVYKQSENESPNKEDVRLNFNQWLQSLGFDGEKEARSLSGLPSVGGIAKAAAPTPRNKVGGLQVGTCRLKSRQRMENWLGCTEIKGRRHAKRFEQKSSAHVCPDKVQKPTSSARQPMKSTSSPNRDSGMPNRSPRPGSVTPSKDFGQTLPYLSLDQGNASKCNTNNGALAANVARTVTTRSQRANKMSRDSNKCTSRNARQHFENSKDKPTERHQSAPLSCGAGVNTDTAQCTPDKEKRPVKKTPTKASRQSKKTQRPVNKIRPRRGHQEKACRKVGLFTNQVSNCRKPALFMPSPDTLIEEKAFLDQEDGDVNGSAEKGLVESSGYRGQKKKPSEESSDEFLNDEESFLMAKWAELRNLKPPKAFHSKMFSTQDQAAKQKKKKAIKSGRKIVKLRQCSTKKKLATK
ncbi:unnamed protein product [Lymnaea stagnalis]|uniref:Uncharacterized protein n=1 Tax=Lymnaea stagnalis TaxID=6523 RepID=A0AAV2HQM8_LYMST